MNVYDFDNTIYRGESAVDLFWYYLKQDKSLLRYVPEVAAALVLKRRNPDGSSAGWPSCS